MPSAATAPSDEATALLRRTIDAEIVPYVQRLRKAATARTLRVPDTFVHAPGTERQAAYAENLIGKLWTFADDRLQELQRLGIDADRFNVLVEQAAFRDRLMSCAASAVEKVPQALVGACVAAEHPWTQAASRADPTKGAEAGGIVGFTANGVIGLFQQYFGQYAKSVVLGTDPYYTKPSRSNTHPAMLEVLDALPTPTLWERFKLGFHASRGMDDAAATTEAVSTALTGAGVAHPKVVAVGATVNALSRLGMFGWSASGANRKNDTERGQQGAMPLLARTNLEEIIGQIEQPLISAHSAGRALVKTGQVAVSPVAALLPPAWVNDYMGLAAPKQNTHRPAVVSSAITPTSYIGSAFYAIAGLLGGVGNGALNLATGADPSGDNLRQAGFTALRGFYNYLASVVNTVSLTAGNSLGAHLGPQPPMPVHAPLQPPPQPQPQPPIETSHLPAGVHGSAERPDIISTRH